ncbi:HPF/RaiA family ribosome-associated protein [uncultured Dokdonia sp.]|uniref:HPF/RaiA family ribosome-associated protein n=1 Tax=uncultured Dokdonia sp. TaxID=575653 RepID=UPI002630EB42|nr:HPF/RaiA family ribosome-associated protein [uncultured Dokdonia sp.]
MTIEIQFVKIATSEALTQYIHTKIEPLFKKYPWLIKAQVFVKKANDSKGNQCICEIEMSLPGTRLYASSAEENYQVAVKNTVSDIEKQLKKRKQSIISH